MDNCEAMTSTSTCLFYCSLVKGNIKFWYGVMNLVQMNILEAYAILQYSVIVVPVEIESKFMKL